VTRGSALLAGALFGALALASCDPVASDAKAALGDEAPGVSRGPLHRPGQPCIVCHDGGVGDPPAFAVAGTVFDAPNSPVPASGVTVTLTGSNGHAFSAVTNAAGNFYVVPDEFIPAYPMKVTISVGGVTNTMQSHVGRDGSCAGCHTDPPRPSSPGRVYFSATGVMP
jgi:hypothetical protein